MGIHITIKNLAGERHPDWDWIRYGNDKEFFYGVLMEQDIEWIVDEGDTLGMRPKDIEGLREAIREEDYSNEDRYLGFCDLLEADGQWFVGVAF